MMFVFCRRVLEWLEAQGMIYASAMTGRFKQTLDLDPDEFILEEDEEEQGGKGFKGEFGAGVALHRNDADGLCLADGVDDFDASMSDAEV